MLVLCVLTANTSFRNIYVWTGMPGTGAWYEPGRACVGQEAAFQLISALLEGDGRDLLSSVWQVLSLYFIPPHLTNEMRIRKDTSIRPSMYG